MFEKKILLEQAIRRAKDSFYNRQIRIGENRELCRPVSELASRVAVRHHGRYK